MTHQIPARWQSSKNPSKIETSGFVEQYLTEGQRYIAKKKLTKYFDEHWPWAASEITIKVYSLTLK